MPKVHVYHRRGAFISSEGTINHKAIIKYQQSTSAFFKSIISLWRLQTLFLSLQNSFHFLEKSKTMNWPLLAAETSSNDWWLKSIRGTVRSQAMVEAEGCYYGLQHSTTSEPSPSLTTFLVGFFPLALLWPSLPPWLSSHIRGTLLSHAFSLLLQIWLKCQFNVTIPSPSTPDPLTLIYFFT